MPLNPGSGVGPPTLQPRIWPRRPRVDTLIFAVKCSVYLGILVGQLSTPGGQPYGQLNHLKKQKELSHPWRLSGW